MKVSEKEVQSKLYAIDREQRDFFKRVYGLNDARAYEFDLVINCDYIKEIEWAAEIVCRAYEQKFGGRSGGKTQKGKSNLM